jgi:hypothetical protein
MRERPILFNAPMVRAILAGTKTQTRRVVKLWEFYEPLDKAPLMPADLEYLPDFRAYRSTCPYGQPGDRLWVRESFDPIYPQDPSYNGGKPIEYDYQATYKHGDRLGDLIGVKKKWKPSIHMPRRASRITLEITGVRVERLQDISEADAQAEGINVLPTLKGQACNIDGGPLLAGGPRLAFRDLWQSINGPESWQATPWVWVVEFKPLEAPW